ncbi:centrosomal protein of 164 kDa isoform X2 [Macrosteles quadrilineatus]|uniref:centrosomal protein of 164 kDa isoform X2 n=1 Tax=Macrosteles quadrilineatus TaxID=74068 RepID=UPI0023E18914|nr:centrosomal protein of 164 kDa isoform X2 [Macrosteles quadrilineatus]
MERRLHITYAPEHFYNNGHNVNSRAVARFGPYVRPVIPLGGFWVPPHCPIPYRPVYTSPHTIDWHASLSSHLFCNSTRLKQTNLLPPLPSPFHNLNSEDFSSNLQCSSADVTEVIKIHIEATKSKKRISKPSKINSSKPNLTDESLENEEIEENYNHDKMSGDLDPEVLASWRESLRKPKENSSTHELKIEISVENNMQKSFCETAEEKTSGEKTKPNSKSSKENSSLNRSSKSKRHKKISSSSADLTVSTSSKKDGLGGIKISLTKETKRSSMNAKTSSLRFTPIQVHRVHKKTKERSHSNSSINSSVCTPTVETLPEKMANDSESSRTSTKPVKLKRDKSSEESRKSNSRSEYTPSRSPSPEECRKKSKETRKHISNHRSPSRSDRSPEELEEGTRSSRRHRSPSPYRSRSRHSLKNRRSHSSRKSLSPADDADHNTNSSSRRHRYRESSPVRSSLSQTSDSMLSRNSSSSYDPKFRHSSKDADPDDSEADKTIYVTPEGKPFYIRSSEAENRQSSGIKRSLNDDSQSESQSNNSSFNDSSCNSSIYQTPEGTPNEFNKAKRMKIRWSDSNTLSHDYNSPSSSWRHNLSCMSEQGVQPELIGYQMIGDSQFCRFGQQLLGLQRMPMPNCPGRIGICVSGQTITDLHKRVRDNFYPISDKIILMIGTNDFLRNVNVSRMCEELSALVKTLQKSASNIILLTLPPIPKLAKKNTNHFELLDIYNQHIRSLDNGDSLRIGDISPLYMTCPPYQSCRMHLFELFFGGPDKRHDLIHLNRLGLEVIRKYSFLFNQRKCLLLTIETEEQLVEEVNKEVRDYAIKIGINPDTEKHLLTIALDGLMSPLPEEWKACLDERVNRIYYYNVKTHQTQWTHPLDEHFESIVKKKRQEESISAGDDDSKTSMKEDLKSFEEAVTTSDMLPSKNLPSSHKSRLTSPAKPPSPDGRKVLNPIGRPPLPPKRRATSTSPKRGLSLRLSSPAPSPSRIDIDSLGVPVNVTAGLPSPDVKEKSGARSPGIKLTGGGSAFLKSKQKQSPSPTDEAKKLLDDSGLKSFEIVREADSLDSSDEKSPNNEVEDRKLKHSLSLGESGFDKLIKSKKFVSLQESLSSLKSELEISSSDLKSPNTSGLRGILRDKPSPTTKLWDVDPALLTSEEKEKLRIQEMKDERKQNVRFADIINKPINIEFSKSDSEDESTTNDSSNDLDDLILENMHSDDELRKENKLLENSLKLHMKLDDNENTKIDSSPESLTKDMSSPGSNKSNRNIISRLSDLGMDSKKKRDTKTNTESDNINRESGNWLTDTEDIMNQNEKKIQALRKNVYDVTKISWDAENNPIDKHLTELGFAQTQGISPRKQGSLSPVKKTQMEILNKELMDSYQLSVQKMKQDSGDFDLKQMSDDVGDGIVKSKDVRKSRLMPNVDLQKVFQSVKESLLNSSEHSDSELEPMETSPLGPGEEDESGAGYKTDDRTWEKFNRNKDRKFEDYKERQKKVFEEKKSVVYQEYDDTMEDIRNELRRQESIERQRIHAEVQQSMMKYREEVEKEKNEREAEIRNLCEEYLKELEAMLSKEKELKIKKMKEEHEMFMKDQEKKLSEEKAQFEEEKMIRMHTSSSQLEKIVAELKEKEDQEIARLKEQSEKKLEAVRKQVEEEQAEQEKRHKQELAIVEAEYERVLGDKQRAKEQLKAQQEAEIAATKAQHQAALDLLAEQHTVMVRQLEDQAREEEEFMRRKHCEKMETLNAQLSRTSEKEDVTQLNREFEKVRCEKRLLEDKYKSLKEKYVRLKSEVRLSMERKRQAKLNRQLQHQRDPASTTEDTSADHGKPPLARRKLVPAFSSDEGTGDNANGTPKTIKRRPKLTASMTTSSAAEQSSSSAPPQRPKNVWNPSPRQRREGVSSAEDNHTSVSEEIQLEQDDCADDKWVQSALSPLENLRKQLEKLDDLEEQFPTSVHTDTYLRYPFSGPGNEKLHCISDRLIVVAGGSCELDFYRHRLHLEREAVRRAKQALAEQRLNIEARQLQLRHRQHSQTLNTFHQEERDLTDMEVSLHRTRALLGEKIIRLRYLEQSIDRAAAFTPHHSHSHDSTTATNTDSSGFSGSDLDLSNGHVGVARSEVYWTENVLQSLENINSEIREIWTILGKQQVPGLGPPPVLNCESRAIAGTDTYAPQRATDIADRTRKLKEWLVRTREQQTYMVAPVNL